MQPRTRATTKPQSLTTNSKNTILSAATRYNTRTRKPQLSMTAGTMLTTLDWGTKISS